MTARVWTCLFCRRVIVLDGLILRLAEAFDARPCCPSCRPDNGVVPGRVDS